MKKVSPSVKYSQAVFSLAAILALFLLVTVGAVFLHERNMLRAEKTQFYRELDLIGAFLSESMLEDNYDMAEAFLNKWGAEQDDVVVVKATTPDGEVLVNYKRKEPAEEPFGVKRTVTHQGEELLTIEVVKDLKFVRSSLVRLGEELIGGAFLLLLMTGLGLWYSVKKLALLPLESEIARRNEAETELQKTQNELEARVLERTDELQKEMEAAQRYLDVAGVAFIVVSKDQKVYLINRMGCQILGYSEDEVVGKNWFDNFLPERYRKDAKMVHDLLMKEEVEPIRYYESPVITKSGEERVIAWYNTILYDEDGKPASLLSSGEDITRRRSAEDALAYSESFLRSIIDTEPECVKLVASDGVLLQMNAAGCAMLEADDPSEVPGKSVYPFIIPEHRDSFKALLQSVCKGTPGSLEFEVTGVKGTRRWLETHAVPFRDKRQGNTMMLSVTRDVTERRKLEERLNQARKMEAIGTLTGGIAHDFNNILSAIIGFGESVEMDMAPDDPLRPYLEQMLAAAEKGTKLTHSLLAFGRKLIIKPSPVKLNNILTGVEKIIGGLLGEGIKVELVLTDPNLTVMADAPKMEQALINLVTNARDSMPQGGSLRLSAAEVTIDDEFIKRNGFGKEGSFGVLSVSDSGMGMDEATRLRIFEPFYTTKAPGMGTGLGLSTVYGVVKQHGGYIDVRSEPGKGSTFSIYLPQIKLVENKEAAPPAPPLVGGTETVLIAEDDAAVRRITKDVLGKFGYTVLEAEDGARAVELFMEHKDEVDLLLFDITMPKKSGREAYEEIVRVRPDIKALFTSGNVTEVVNREVVGEGHDFIAKPASPKQIIRKVREILDKKS